MNNDIPKIRGGIILALRNCVILKHRREMYNEILSELDEEYRTLIDSVIVFKEYYDLRAYHKFLDVYQEKVTPEEYIECASYLARQDLKGIFLLFARLLSKEYLIKKMSDMWRKVHTQGEIKLLYNNEKSTAIRVKNVLTTSEAFRVNLEHYMKTILEIATKETYRSESRIHDETTYEFAYHLL
jgi:hypothetical protein